MLQLNGLNIRCLEFPQARDGAYKEWDLEEMHYLQDSRDKKWKKFVNHLHSARHRRTLGGGCGCGRLGWVVCDCMLWGFGKDISS